MPTAEAHYYITEIYVTPEDHPLHSIAHYNPQSPIPVIHTLSKHPECNSTAVFLSVTPNKNQIKKKDFSNILHEYF